MRKGREDAKDAPGASDFYYGEMAMRRRHEGGLLLFLYWLVSGYGTKAWRALAGFLVLVVVLGVLMHAFGFAHPQSWLRTVAFTLGSSVYLARAPATGLTATGDLLQLGLRVVGPVLLGLTFLALRARVKR